MERSRVILVSALAAALGGCGAVGVDSKEKLVIAMTGAFEAPVDATGTHDPRYVRVWLADVTFELADGTVVDVWDAEEPAEYRIVARSQILHEVDVSEYVGAELSPVRVTFLPAIFGVYRGSAESGAELAPRIVESAEALAIRKGVSKRLEIKMSWKNTVTLDEATSPPTESLQSPALSAVLKDD